MTMKNEIIHVFVIVRLYFIEIPFHLCSVDVLDVGKVSTRIIVRPASQTRGTYHAYSENGRSLLLWLSGWLLLKLG